MEQGNFIRFKNKNNFKNIKNNKIYKISNKKININNIVIFICNACMGN